MENNLTHHPSDGPPSPLEMERANKQIMKMPSPWNGEGEPMAKPLVDEEGRRYYV